MDNKAVIDSFFKKEDADKATKDHVIMVIDNSGSMNEIKSDAEGGINAFVEDQRKFPNGTYVSVIEFDYTAKVTQEFVDISEFKKYELNPSGGTALLDAIGTAITTAPKIDGKTIVVIVTDGEENSSKQYTRDRVFEMVSAKKDEGWDFIFLAADQDAITTGGSLGIGAQNTFEFTKSGKGVTEVYAAAAMYSSNSRCYGADIAVTTTDFIKSQFNDIS